MNHVGDNTCINNAANGNYNQCFMTFAVPYTGKTYNGTVLSDPRWSTQYYDATIEYADMIRNNGGIIYAIGLGGEPAVTDDFYQDENDDFRRHDYFLTRLALDPYVCSLNKDQIPAKGELGCGLNDNCDMTTKVRKACAEGTHMQWDAGYTGYESWNTKAGLQPDKNNEACYNFYNPGEDYPFRYKYGQYLPTSDARELPALFDQIAKKILISLSR